MNSRFFRRQAILLALTLTCSAAMLAGCANNTDRNTSSINDADRPHHTVYSPTVPENRVDDDAPGQNIDAVIGEEVNYDNKITAKVNQVVEIDDVNKANGRTLLAEMTITNNSDAAIDCSTLTHFSLIIDDQEDIEPLRNVVSAIIGRKYYTQIKSDLQNFNSKIEAGQTLTGYVYIGAPTSWKSLKLVYIPYRYYNTDRITYDIKEDELVHYTEDLP